MPYIRDIRATLTCSVYALVSYLLVECYGRSLIVPLWAVLPTRTEEALIYIEAHLRCCSLVSVKF